MNGSREDQNKPITFIVGSSEPYKSIDELSWENVPPFAVLTGLNGSGKSQLLELIAYSLTNVPHPQGIDVKKTNLSVIGYDFDQDSVIYIPTSGSFTGSSSLGIGQMQQVKLQLWQQLFQNRGQRLDFRSNLKRARILKLLGKSPNERLDQDEFVAKLPDDMSYMIEEMDITAGLSYIFLAHKLRQLQELDNNVPKADLVAKIGPAPWDLVNEVLRTAEFPYEVLPPSSNLLEMYKLVLQDRNNNRKIDPENLSSGEKVILQLVVWLYSSNHHNVFPKLLLLDEPDAHLHPSTARQLMDVIKEVLVDRYGVRVILTTHSPSTVALAPEECLFEMFRENPRIRVPTSKSDAIGRLTAGLVIVTKSSRYVLVEDQSDVEFYGAVRDILSDYGPSKDQKHIRSSPSLIFLPASRGEGATKIGGGSTVVLQWVEKFDAPPLDELFRGIIDRDASNTPTYRVQVLGRYSIENYLLDPMIIFGLLLEEGRAIEIANLRISIGDEHLLRTLSQQDIQSIINGIKSKIEPHLPNFVHDDTIVCDVIFTTGATIQYPAWMLDRRGHDLLPIFQCILGGPRLISPPRLLKSLRRVRIIPIELADIMHALQR